MRALLIDTDKNSLEKVAKVFKDAGIDCIFADNIKKALLSLKDNDIDIIISEVAISRESDGFDFIKELKNFEALSRIPFVFLTEKSDLEEKISGLEFGAEDYITKPADIEELAARAKIYIKKAEEKYGIKEEKPVYYSGVIRKNLVRDFLGSALNEKKCGKLTLSNDDQSGSLYFSNGFINDGEINGEESLEKASKIALFDDGEFDVAFDTKLKIEDPKHKIDLDELFVLAEKPEEKIKKIGKKDTQKSTSGDQISDKTSTKKGMKKDDKLSTKTDEKNEISEALKLAQESEASENNEEEIPDYAYFDYEEPKKKTPFYIFGVIVIILVLAIIIVLVSPPKEKIVEQDTNVPDRQIVEDTSQKKPIVLSGEPQIGEADPALLEEEKKADEAKGLIVIEDEHLVMPEEIKEAPKTEKTEQKQAEQPTKVAAAAQATTYDGLIAQGKNALNQRLLRFAEDSYKKAMKKNPNRIEAYLGLGRTYMEKNKLYAARSEFEDASNRFPKSPEVWLMLGTVEQTLGMKAEAELAFDMYLKIKPTGQTADEVRTLLKNLRRK